MNIAGLKGVIPAMATPFAEDESIDAARTAELIAWYLSEGVHGISVAGSQGEFFTLNGEEQLKLIEMAAKAIAGRVPLYAGTGGVSTRESIRMTQAAEGLGATVALVITPYFVQPNQDELVEHYTAIARATKLPVLLYNNPPRTGVNVLPRTLKKCMERAPNIVGVKDSSGDITQSVESKLVTERRGLLFSGRDTVTLSLLMHGAEGTISPAANVFPRLLVKMYDAFVAGDMGLATRISDILAPLREAWAWGSFPVVIKEAQTLVGRSAGKTRRPILPLAENKRADLAKVIKDISAAEAVLAAR